MAEKEAEILKDSTEARKTSITLTKLNYGGQLSEQLLKYSKQMESAYKKMCQLDKDGNTKALKKVMKWAEQKKPWFKQAQAH